ncbi:sulfite exporter TauE/SafE family protein [Saccharopolyspora sp. NFXS83]|uniref:sulfite exporter TauE/SafE family protein n=1 Tax=Saccharopolyspora sp. NFXS83 TaxID=2993560 RepID=UPI00224A6B03|nr:sulfite exporter TauE/SafE family protein [Saccharopolyspora sp. NFXS83]MCX2730272.1 sulfite exporter TauE/SafE family protein [Saccharopolyspora sp. NFXS83]
MDLGVTLTGLLTGLLVGLTGMGGGALTMPLLTLVFGVPPLAAVSTDLVASAVMKPVGAAVHLRRRTVHLPTVGLLCVGSLPCAAIGSVLAGSLGAGTGTVLKAVSAVAVLLAAATLVVRMYLDRGRSASGEQRVRPVPTVLLGAVAGFIVGTTSVGSGSIVIVCLLLLDRAMNSARLVGTDLVQAVPLVLVAALGHLLHGEVHFGLVGSLLAGSLPGVLAGALLSARIPDRPVRVLLGGMLAVTGSMLLGLGAALAAALGTVVALAAAITTSEKFSRDRAPAPAGDRIDAGAEGGTG